MAFVQDQKMIEAFPMDGGRSHARSGC
jgi:hypothetical protein